MKLTYKPILTILSLLFTVSVAAAQVADCAAYVGEIIESARAACTGLDINQLCYGSSPLSIQPLPNVRLDFSEPGDIVDPALIESVDLDVTDDSFGIVVTRFRTYGLEESVTLVAFGDVALYNLSRNPSDYIILPIAVNIPQGVNVRLEPSPDAEVIAQLIARQTVDADGRTEDGAWLRLRAGGWVSVDVMDSSYDLTLLKVLPPDAHPLVQFIDRIDGPSMQSFRVDSTPHQSDCAEVPDSGVLVQTPDGVGEAVVKATGLEFILRGTVLIQGAFKHDTTISVLEGEIVARGTTVSAGESYTYSFDLDNTFYSDVTPEYNYVRALFLPLVLLPREIELPFSLGGVIYPFTPGTGFLNDIPADGTCTVAWAGDVNLRAGPGTNYPIRQGVPGGYYGEPDARAVGTDGRVWWRLAEDIWIAADATVGGGACGALPLVDPPPVETG
jgi:hypothetical protein